MIISFSGLPSPIPSVAGSWNSRPSYSTTSRAHALRTISTYSRVRDSGRVNGTPYQPSETCGPETPSPIRKRPFEITSIVAAAIAAPVGGRAGICISAEPRWIRSVRSASTARIDTASWPQASETQSPSMPASSACAASASCSSKEIQGQYPSASCIRIGGTLFAHRRRPAG